MATRFSLLIILTLTIVAHTCNGALNQVLFTCPTWSQYATSPVLGGNMGIYLSNSLFGTSTSVNTGATVLYDGNFVINQNVQSNPISYVGWVDSVAPFGGTGTHLGPRISLDNDPSAVAITQANAFIGINCLAARTRTASLDTTTTVLTGTWAPGVYDFTNSLSVDGSFNLNGLGSPDSIFIFRAPTIVTTPALQFGAINNGNFQNLYFISTNATAGQINVNLTPFMQGHLVVVNGNVILTNTNLYGRVVATRMASASSGSSVTFHTSNCTVNACTAPITPAPTAPPVVPPPVAAPSNAPIAPPTPPPFSGPPIACPAIGAADGFAITAYGQVDMGHPLASVVVNGSVGSANSTVIGFPPGIITNGLVQNGTAAAMASISAANAVWDCVQPFRLQGNCTQFSAPTSTNATFTPGVYCTNDIVNGAHAFAGTLTFDGQNQTTPTFIFVVGNLQFNTGLRGTLINGATYGNILFTGNQGVTIQTDVISGGHVISKNTLDVNSSANVTWTGTLAADGIVATGITVGSNLTISATNCTAPYFCFVSPTPIAPPVAPPVAPPTAAPVKPAPPVNSPATDEITGLQIGTLVISALVLVAVALSMCQRAQTMSQLRARGEALLRGAEM